MYSREQLEQILKCDYPDIVSGETKRMRGYNIQNLIKMINEDIEENQLVYGEKERRVDIYTTSKNEHIFIQYPGAYSKPNKKGKVAVPFDFRPVAILENDGKAKDMDFEDIWRILQKFIEGHRNLMGIINTLLFKMGRMQGYRLFEEQTYETQIVMADGVAYDSECINLSIYKMVFEDQKIIDSLNYLAEDIDAGGGEKMSMEAFLYYFELLLQIEDCKYNRDKVENDRGRIPSSDSLIIVSSYSNHQIDLANMLMRFVRYRGIARCEMSEYPIATNGIVSITPVKNHIEEICKQNNILCRRPRKFKVNNEVIENSIRLEIESKRILIVDDEISMEIRQQLSQEGWTIFNINDFLGDKKQAELDKLIIDAPEKGQPGTK